MASINDVLHLSEKFGIQASEPGVLVVEYVFSILWQLLDATLDDEGLQELTPEKKSKWISRPHDMEIDGEDAFDEKKTEYNEKLQKANTIMAIELIWHFLNHKVISKLLSLARENMYEFSISESILHVCKMCQLSLYNLMFSTVLINETSKLMHFWLNYQFGIIFLEDCKSKRFMWAQNC